ncbi:PAS domain-containing protein [Neobacillus sp. Marseille-QA0830]
MYKHIFNVSIDGLVLWDNQHRIIDANPAAELLWNSPPGEANREAI